MVRQPVAVKRRQIRRIVPVRGTSTINLHEMAVSTVRYIAGGEREEERTQPPSSKLTANRIRKICQMRVTELSSGPRVKAPTRSTVERIDTLVRSLGLLRWCEQK